MKTLWNQSVLLLQDVVILSAIPVLALLPTLLLRHFLEFSDIFSLLVWLGLMLLVTLVMIFAVGIAGFRRLFRWLRRKETPSEVVQFSKSFQEKMGEEISAVKRGERVRLTIEDDGLSS